MRFRTWPVAALGLGGLLLLVIVSVQAASNRAQEIYTQLDQLNPHHRDVETKLPRLRSDVHLSGIFMRDYLLDPERAHAPIYRERLAEFRQQQRRDGRRAARADAAGVRMDERIAQPRDQARRLLASVRSAVRLDAGREDHPELQLPAARSAAAARGRARDRLRDRGAEQREPRDSARRGHAAARRLPQRAAQDSLWGSLLLGLVVALTAVIRLRILERRSENSGRSREEAEEQMRQLSQQLVATQEEERKNLSRELHDHVGQVLTALRMELGRIDRLRSLRASTVPADRRGRRRMPAAGRQHGAHGA